MTRTTRSLMAFSTAAFVALVTGCGGDGSGNATTGKRIALHTAWAPAAATTATFTTGFKWKVTLTKGAVALAGLYYFDGPPPTAGWRPREPTPGERLQKWLGLGTAWAHPGHYQAGTALGEVLLPTPVALDLFAPGATTLPDGDGTTGVYRSGRFVLAMTPPSAGVLGGHVAILEGKAEKADGTSPQPIYFRLVADYADVSANVTNGAVDGCVLDEVTVTDSGTVTLEVQPTVWLDLVDFSSFAPGSADAPTEAKSAGFSQGVTELSAYHFTYSK